jgi:ribosomal protein S18 acetylase RimI-like enzyme
VSRGRVVVRRLLPDDAQVARVLAASDIAGTPYAEAPMHALERALDGDDPEAWGLVAVRDAELVGLVLLGLVAGAQGAGRLHLIVVTASARFGGVGRLLLDRAADEAAQRGARFLLAEIPEDPVLAPAHELLRRAGFRTESRIADFIRDGIGIAFARRDLA